MIDRWQNRKPSHKPVLRKVFGKKDDISLRKMKNGELKEKVALSNSQSLNAELERRKPSPPPSYKKSTLARLAQFVDKAQPNIADVKEWSISELKNYINNSNKPEEMREAARMELTMRHHGDLPLSSPLNQRYSS